MIAIPLDKEVLEEDTLSSDIFATFEALFTKENTGPLKTELTQFIKYCLDDEITLKMIIFTKPSHGSPNQNKLIINQPEQTENQ